MSGSGTDGTNGAAGGGNQDETRNDLATGVGNFAQMFGNLEEYMHHQQQRMQMIWMKNQGWFQNQYDPPPPGYGVAHFTGPAMANIYHFETPGNYNVVVNNYQQSQWSSQYSDQNQAVGVTRYVQSQPSFSTEFGMEDGSVDGTETNNVTIATSSSAAASCTTTESSTTIVSCGGEGMSDECENGAGGMDMTVIGSSGQRGTKTVDKEGAAAVPNYSDEESGTEDDDTGRVEGREVQYGEHAVDGVECRYEMDEEMECVCDEIDQLALFEKKPQ